MTGVPFRWRWHSPAGERVSLRVILDAWKAGSEASQEWIGFDSGTSALAAALAFGQERLSSDRRVALPAYSCPSLVSAALFAGLEPVFLDCEPDALSPGPARYQRAIAGGCSLLVLVDLFGIPAPVEELLTPSPSSSTWLVHDRAQSLCAPGIPINPGAHAVVSSFGRGKPVTLLGGGAVACREHEEFRRFVEARYPLQRWNRAYGLARAGLYDLALTPALYGLIARLPGLGLGDARLVRLSRITRLAVSLLGAAAEQARIVMAADDRHVERCRTLSHMAAEASYREPHHVASAYRPCAVNRFPLLCASEAHAESLYERGRRLGISRMYRRTLPEFLGRSASDAARNFPNAYDLSRRIVTLPTHSRLSRSELSDVQDVLNACR